MCLTSDNRFATTAQVAHQMAQDEREALPDGFFPDEPLLDEEPDYTYADEDDTDCPQCGGGGDTMCFGCGGSGKRRTDEQCERDFEDLCERGGDDDNA